jgi:hypothetical protein
VGHLFALRVSKHWSYYKINWHVDCHPYRDEQFFVSHCDSWQILVSLPILVWSYVCNEPKWSDSRENGMIWNSTVMLTVCLSSVSLIILNAFPSGEWIVQEYFVHNILPDLCHEKMWICPKYRQGQFFADMNNSKCDNSRNITDEISDAKLENLFHPSYSPYVNPCDFWIFGMLKHKMNDREFQTIEEIVTIMKPHWRAWHWETCNPSSSIGLNVLNGWLNMEKHNTLTEIKKLSESLSYVEVRGDNILHIRYRVSSGQ